MHTSLTPTYFVKSTHPAQRIHIYIPAIAELNKSRETSHVNRQFARHHFTRQKRY